MGHGFNISLLVSDGLARFGPKWVKADEHQAAADSAALVAYFGLSRRSFAHSCLQCLATPHTETLRNQTISRPDRPPKFTTPPVPPRYSILPVHTAKDLPCPTRTVKDILRESPFLGRTTG